MPILLRIIEIKKTSYLISTLLKFKACSLSLNGRVLTLSGFIGKEIEGIL